MKRPTSIYTAVMAAHDNHHYVPRFLLEAWRSPPDNLLSTIHWLYGDRLKHGRHSPKAVAKLFQLYSLRGQTDPNRIERDFLGSVIDAPGAEAYHVILNAGVDQLTATQETSWARFLVSLLMRGPDMVDKVRAAGELELRRSLAESPDEYAAMRGSSPANTLLEYVETNLPDVFHNMAPSALPQLIMSPNLNKAILEATWITRNVAASTIDLVIGDKPLIYAGTMKQSFLLALPLSPHQVFLAYNVEQTGRNVIALPVSRLVRQINFQTVNQAMQYVYAAHERHYEYVKRYLKRI